MKEENRSISYWIQQLKDNNPQAARELWNLYFHRLISLAGKRLGSIPQRVVDPEDVAVGVFTSLCLGASRGQFPLLENADDLWRLLVSITRQQAVDHLRRALSRKRGGGKVRGDSVFMQAGRLDEQVGFDSCPGTDPQPDSPVIQQDEFQHLLSLLHTEDLRRVALSRLDGKTNGEIAEEMQISRRSVERKLNLIRESWEGRLGVSWGPAKAEYQVD